MSFLFVAGTCNSFQFFLKKSEINMSVFRLNYFLTTQERLFRSIQGNTCCPGLYWNTETSSCESRFFLGIFITPFFFIFTAYVY